MKNLLELKRSMGRILVDGLEYQVFAEATANYDHTTHILSVELRCFLQQDSTDRKIIHPEWMPHQQTDREHVDQDEATDLGRDIFRRWCDSIRHSAPKPLQ